MTQTRIVPIPRGSVNKMVFVSSEKVKPHEVILGGVKVLTAPLKPDVDIYLLEVSFDKDLIASGQIDLADTIDRRVLLSTLYVQLAGGINMLDVSNRPTMSMVRSHDDADILCLHSIIVVKPWDLDINARGTLDLRTGKLRVTFSTYGNGKVIGYEMMAYRNTLKVSKAQLNAVPINTNKKEAS